MKTLKLCVATVTLALSSIANAQFWTGNEFLRRATSGDTVDRIWSMGYVAGAIDLGNRGLFCVPQQVTVGQATDMVVRAIQQAPSTRHFAAADLLAVILQNEWPCPAQPRQQGRS